MQRRFGVILMLLVWISVLLVGCGSQATPTPLPIQLPTPSPVDIPTVVWTPRSQTRVQEPTPAETAINAAPTPTPTPLPPMYGWVKPLKARLRAAPGLDAEVIDVLPAGTSLQLLGRSADGQWYYVRVLPLQGNEKEGWMAAEVIVTFVEPDALPVVEGKSQS